MSAESTTGSRRALLAAGLGALAATIASPLRRPATVRAGIDGDVVLGEPNNVATTITGINNNANANTVLRGRSTGGGIGVLGASNSGEGVRGSSQSFSGVRGQSSTGTGIDGFSATGTAVFGRTNSDDKPGIIGWSSNNRTGVLGFSSGVGGQPPAAQAKTGLYGHATQDSGSRGVWGRANAGRGVDGQATSGVGVYGRATTGFAFRGNARLKFDKVSGVATIAAGQTAVTVSPGVNVTNGSFVLLTPRHNIGSRGLWYVPNTSNNTFQIRLSSSRSSNTKIAWLLVG